MTSILTAADKPSAPPAAKQLPRELKLHGDRLVDPYFWLREKSNPEVIAHLEAENRYTEAVMKPFDPLRDKLYQEILGRIQQTDLSVPVRRGDYFYYTRTEEGKQYPIHCRKKASQDASEEVLLDVNALAAGQKYCRVGRIEVSPDHKLLAYTADFEGDEDYAIYIKDLADGALLPDRITGVYYSLEWAEDNKTLFYNTIDAARRPYKLFRHVLGTDTKTDTLVYHEPDQRFTLNLFKTRSRGFLMIHLESQTTTEVRYLPAAEPGGEFRIVEPRRQDIEYDVDHHGSVFYIRVNDGGKNFRLVRAPVNTPSKENWKEIIPHRQQVLLERVEPFREHLVLVERDRGLRQLRIQKLATGAEHYVAFEEPAYALHPTGNLEFDTDVLRFQYSSLVTPSSVFDYNMDDKTRELKKQQPVLGGYDPSQYASERIFATAPDGVKVPISLVYRKGLRRDGRSPVLLSGYGSYGASSDAAFSSDRLSLLDRGFVFAIGHIRGGADLGKMWHENGRMLKKKNTFNDFIACAEHLIAQKYTSPDRLAIIGGSAGGLLMGAVVNRRPELFRAVVAKVPFVDVLNTMLDETLPLTVGEFEEWGNPKQQQYYEYIRSYSPYDNVTAQKYPMMLVTAGLNDPRVSYWEPAKWVAKLRAMKKDDNVLLLKTEMGAGHFGPSGRYERYKETAFDYAFLLFAMGIKE
jgi:oligopeptidase B